MADATAAPDADVAAGLTALAKDADDLYRRIARELRDGTPSRKFEAHQALGRALARNDVLRALAESLYELAEYAGK